MTLRECRKDIEFAGEKVQAYTTLNDAGGKAIGVGFDEFFPGGQVSDSRKRNFINL